VKSLVRRIPLALGALVLLGCDPDPTTGSIVVDVSGIPTGAVADVRVTGPNDFDQTVPATTTLEQLPPGEYHVSINAVTHGNGLFTAPQSQQALTVAAGRTETVAIAYTLSGGSIDLAISGLPTGIPPQVRLLGPLGFSRMVLTSGLQVGLPAGTYTIRADTLGAADGDRYGPSTFLQTVTVPASLSPVAASVAYGVVSGTLNVVVQGLVISPSAPPVTITGPDGFQRTTTASATYRGLLAGDYTITAASAGSCPTVYTPAQSTQTVTVPAAASGSGTVSYGPASNDPANLNLRIDGGYLVQATQDYAGTVPMIAGRRALLRVFAAANQCNTATPQVRVTLGDGTVYGPISLGAGENSTRLTPEQGFLAASYNVEIPAEKVTAGLTWVAEIDPSNAYAETSESDNRFPATGSRSVTVRTLNPTQLRFVPVTFSANNTTGDITGSARVDSFMVLSRKLLPVHSFDVDTREPFTTAKPVLQANDQNGSWGQVLVELRTAQQADPSGRYYYGVVKVSYSSGVAGIGFIGGKTAMGWDYLPSGSDIMAHELGHNFNALHTPCGGPGGVDQDYPTTGTYAGGYMGTYGFDFADNTVKTPQQFTDLMGYCNTQWISDFSYSKMLAWLSGPGASAVLPSVRSANAEPGLLVWGRIVNGQPVLEPAFEIDARTQIPAQGAHRLSAIGADGREIFSVSFDADRIADLPGEQEAFAMVLPKSMLRGRDLASLKLTARGGRTATNVQASALSASSGATLARTGPRALRVRWDATRYPVVMVRNPQTGSILSFARGGDVTIATDRDDVELNYSNRVRSIRELRRAQ
jgi:hypothetical protein